MLNALAELFATVELNVTKLLVVVNVVSAPKVTAPVYVCVPLVVTDPPKVDAPLTDSADVPAVRVMLFPVAIDKLAMV
jgi:hypothetical protein